MSGFFQGRHEFVMIASIIVIVVLSIFPTFGLPIITILGYFSLGIAVPHFVIKLLLIALNRILAALVFLALAAFFIMLFKANIIAMVNGGILDKVNLMVLVAGISISVFTHLFSLGWNRLFFPEDGKEGELAETIEITKGGQSLSEKIPVESEKTIFTVKSDVFAKPGDIFSSTVEPDMLPAEEFTEPPDLRDANKKPFQK